MEINNPNYLNDENKQIDNIGNHISDFINLKILGNGYFGTILKMKSKINNQIYAVELIKIESIDESEKIKIMREQKILSSISHPNIVKLCTTFQDDKYFCLVTEFFSSQNLESFVEKFKEQNQNGYINQDLVIKIFKQILLGLSYLHSKRIMHRDLKADNILIDENNNIKISGFKISAMYGEGFGILSSRGSRVGRIDYACPEILNSQAYDLKCDIFTLGYTMYYIMNYQLPSNLSRGENGEIKRIDNIKSNDKYDIKLVELVNRMFRENPSERPSSLQALQELEVIEKNIKSY